MILAEALLDAHGHMLLPRGTTLTAADLASLPRHGIAVLAVQVRDGRIDHLFRKLDPDSADAWAAKQLRQYLTAYRQGGA